MNDNKNIMDRELQESIEKLHDLHVEEEMQELRELNETSALNVELVQSVAEREADIAELEEEIASAKRAIRKYKAGFWVLTFLCAFCLVARLITL